MIYGAEPTDELVAHILKKFDLGITIQELASVLRDPAALLRAQVPAHLRFCIRALLSSTWFTVQGVQYPGTSTAGTKAGDPLGDLLFNLVEAKALELAEQRILEEDMALRLDFAKSSGFFPTQEGDDQAVALQFSYVDDGVFVVQAPTAELLVVKVARIAELVFATFESHGLRINFSKGKTEVSLRLAGRNSRQTRVDIETQGGIPIRVANKEIMLSVVREYKHMGAISTPSRAIRPEAMQRAASAKQALRTLGKALSSGGYALAVKFSLIESLVETRLFFNGCVWSAVDANSVVCLDKVRVLAWRKAKGWLNVPDEKRIPDRALWVDVGKMTALQVLRVHRLRYLPRFYKTAPPMLLALVQASTCEGSWPLLVMEDLAAMEAALPEGNQVKLLLKDPIDPRAFGDFMRAGARGWRSAVATLAGSLARATSKAAAAAADPGVVGAPGAQPPAAVPLVTHECEHCHAEFDSYPAVLGHMAKKHGYRNPLRAFAQTEVCPCCNYTFWTRERLFHHFMRSKCGSAVLLHCEPALEPEHSLASRAERMTAAGNVRAGRSHRFAACAARRLPGPRPRFFQE